MSALIKVNYKDYIISINGDIHIFQNPRLKIWLRKFDKVEIDNHQLIVYDKSFTRDSLNKFKKSLEHKLQNVKIVFDKNFLDEVDMYIKEEENFEENSNLALQIWEDRYNTSDFKNFTQILESKMKKRSLYRLQLLASYHIAFSQNACNFSVPGSGKTSIVYGAYSYFNNLDFNNKNYINKILVVGPPSSFDPWKDEFEECFGYKPTSIELDGSITLEQKKEILYGYDTTEYNLYLTTYQSIPSITKEIIHFINVKDNHVMMICDEAHKIKSEDGVWAENILKISPYARSRVVLTGTPVPNGYQDLFNLFKFIYPSRNVIKFKRDRLKQLSEKKVQSDIDQVIENIKPYFIRIKKDDLNLPQITSDRIINNGLDSIEAKVYQKLEDTLKDKYSDANKVSIFFRTIQSCNNLNLLIKNNFELIEGFGNIDSKVDLEEVLGPEIFHSINNLDDYIPSKHKQALNLVKEIKNKGGRVVLWGVFIDSIKRLHELLGKNGLNGEIIIGETKKDLNGSYDSEEFNKTRKGIISEFKKEKSKLDYIITMSVVLGESISLHKVCHHSIYFELNYSAGPYIQSRDRIHRVWLKDEKQVDYKTNYYHIISLNSIDENIYETLHKKFKKMLEIINHDIPLLSEDLDNDRDQIIKQIIDGYRVKL